MDGLLWGNNDSFIGETIIVACQRTQPQNYRDSLLEIDYHSKTWLSVLFREDYRFQF